mgnify:CR=1 FL=1
MFLSIPIEYIQSNCIYFKEKKDNIIIQNGYFIPIQYATDTLVINTLFISLVFQDIKCNVQQYYKKCILQNDKNHTLIQYIIQLEYDILNRFHTTKIRTYTIKQQMENGLFKIFSCRDQNQSNCEYILDTCTCYIRISGIWENDTHIGLIYKILTDYGTLETEDITTSLQIQSIVKRNTAVSEA